MYLIKVFLLTVVACFSVSAFGQYFDYDPDHPAQQAPLRKGEKAVIPLDTGDPTYNLWQTPRKDLSEGRKPGLINVQRYLFRPHLWARQLFL